ncbi:hypothetical protein HPB51_010975 [Rhipicephalus microplus]|uniref:Uncharacterized protein n=1 Tax=Rhipicephalus microplus TaxID=6941 RepID=A0A9J6DUR7_RHIMP|nr:hypothetical protein HPB51_010975 [Rhipicephalus microplus]
MSQNEPAGAAAISPPPSSATPPVCVHIHQRDPPLFAGLRGEDVEDWLDEYSRQSLTLAVNKRSGSAVADAPGDRFRAPLWRRDGNGGDHGGTEITPEEFRTADWITKVGKHVKALRDSARGDRQGRQDGNAWTESGAEPGDDRKKTAAANAAYKKLGHKIAERSIASHLPRWPANDYKIIIRPKCGLALTKVPNTRLSEAVRMAAQIPWIKGQERKCSLLTTSKPP